MTTPPPPTPESPSTPQAGAHGAEAAPALTLEPRPTRAHRPGRERRRRPVDLLALLPVLAVAAFMLWEAHLALRADLHLLQARWLVGAWATGERPLTPASWLSAYDATQQALAVQPQDASVRVQMGALYQLAAYLPTQTETSRAPFLRQAAGQYRAAVALRPYDGWAWSSLAELLQATQPDSAERWAAWREARRHAPLEDPVRLAMLRAAFTGWATAPDDVRAWVDTAYDNAPARERQEIDDIALAWGAVTWRGLASAAAAASAPASPELERWLADVRAAVDNRRPLPPPPLPAALSASAP